MVLAKLVVFVVVIFLLLFCLDGIKITANHYHFCWIVFCVVRKKRFRRKTTTLENTEWERNYRKWFDFPIFIVCQFVLPEKLLLFDAIRKQHQKMENEKKEKIEGKIWMRIVWFMATAATTTKNWNIIANIRLSINTKMNHHLFFVLCHHHHHHLHLMDAHCCCC